jgi:glycosyltransferase involved in cell wall biosynthesis
MGFQDGIDYLLRAVHHLVYELGRRDVYCVIIGKGDALPMLKKLTEELGLSDYVWFPGYVTEEELVRYLCSADICIDPDPSNPFNDRSTMIKMMEYMALAKPIVAFDLPEHRVSAGEAAVYAKANDVSDMARQIALLMDDPARRRRMGRIGRERVEKELTWDLQIAGLLNVYEGLRRACRIPKCAPIKRNKTFQPDASI